MWKKNHAIAIKMKNKALGINLRTGKELCEENDRLLLRSIKGLNARGEDVNGFKSFHTSNTVKIIPVCGTSGCHRNGNYCRGRGREGPPVCFAECIFTSNIKS